MVWSQPPYHGKPWLGKLAVIGLAASSSSPSTSSSSTSSSSSSSSIRLQAPHPELKPSERLAALGEICDNNDRNIEGLNQNEWDVYGDFHKSSDESFLRHFESTVASEFGFDDAVFMPSGVMGQSIALLIHHENWKQQQEQQEMKTPQNKKFACHPTSHLLLHENEGFRHLCGFDVAVIKENKPNNSDGSNDNNKGLGLDGEPLRYDHLNDDFQHTLGGWDEDISTLIVELPHRELGGKITPWEDILKIRQFLDKQQVPFHCDGARIFEATSGYDNRSLRELSEPFDSMYISFYKGLGGLAGGMLLGNTAFCDKARTMLRQFGGNLYTLLPYIASAWDGYQQNWVLPNKSKDKSIENGDVSGSINLLSFQEKKEKLVRIVSELSSMDDSFCRIARFEPKVPHVPMIHLYLKPTVEECNKMRDEILAEYNVCIFHRLRPVDPQDSVAKTNGFQSVLELSIGQSNGSVPDETWISSWRKFSERLSCTLTPSQTS
mmetsp:Transcript_54024/g.131147  ORF Transcript_54024/g.131147 Transcript_54024/m.131147 type:complete len:492 (+) Transcript_54024:291-1766(+)